MKRTLAILLCAILVLTCLPIVSAGAKELSLEAKFKLLLNDLELDPNIHQPDRYFFIEMKRTDDWVLIRGGLRDLSVTDGNYRYHYATVGNKLVYSGVNCAPLKSGYGVYDYKTGVFYDITDAWNRNFEGLHDVWNDLFAHYDPLNECGIQLIGDADLDRSLTIMDATRFQRYIAMIEYTSLLPIDPDDYYYGYPIYNAHDYDRDGDFTIMDATKLQRHIAELPNVLDYRLAWDKSIPDQLFTDYPEKTILTDLDGLDPAREDDKMILDAYKTDFFKGHFLFVINNTTQGDLTLKHVSIDKDGVLTAEFDNLKLQNAGYPDAVQHHFIVIEVSNAFLDDVRDTKVNINTVYPEDPTKVKATVVQKDDAKRRKPGSLPEAQGYRFIDSERVFSGDYGTQGSPAFDRIIAYNGYYRTTDVGYLAVIETPAQLSYIFPDRDLSAYDQNFFKQYALAALVYQTEWMYHHNLYLSHLAVKERTLYGEMEILDPVLSTGSETIYYDVHKVKRSDVSGVTDMALWENEDYTKHYLYDSYKNWQNLPHRAEYQPTDNYRSVRTYDTHNGTAVWEDNKSDFRVDTGHTKILGLVYNPEQWKYFLKDHPLPKRPMVSYNGGPLVPEIETDSENPFEEYAYLILDYTKQSVGAEITDVYTNGTELDVFVRENEYVGGSAQTYHSIGIVKLNKGDIQNVKSIHMWLDQVFWDDSAAIVFDDKAKDTAGNESVGQLITDRTELIAFAGKYMSTSAKKKLDGAFGDAYFKYHNLIAAYVPLGSGSDTLSLQGIDRTDYYNPTLDLLVTNEYGVGDTAMNYRAVLVAVSKNNYDATMIKSINVNVIPDYPELIKNIPDSKYKRQLSEVLADAEYSILNTKELETVTGEQNSKGIIFNVNPDYPLDKGWFALVRSRAEFETLFPETDQEGKYNDAFFKDSAILAVFGNGTDTGAVPLLSDVAIVDGSKLYAKAEIRNPYPNKAAETTEPAVWTFHKVAQSAVEDVVSLNFWDTTVSARVTHAEERAYIPQDLSGYRQLNTEEKQPLGLTWNDLSLPKTDTGYTFIVNTVSDMGYYHLPENLYNRQIYDEDYFETYSMIFTVVNAPTNGYNDSTKAYADHYAVKDNTLYLNVYLQKIKEGQATHLTWKTAVVKKSELGTIKAIRYWKPDTDPHPETHPLYTEITPVASRPEVSQIAADYDSPAVTPITMSAPSKYDFSWYSTPLDASDDGYVLLIESRKQLEEYLPGFDNGMQYDDEFFITNAIIATLRQGYDDLAEAHIDSVGIVGDTLWVNPTVYYPPQYDEYGNPVGSPTAPICWTFVKVAKDDVKSVKKIDCWTTAANVQLNYTLDEKYMPDEHLDNYSSHPVGTLVKDASQIGAALDAVFTDPWGNVNRDYHTFKVESAGDTAFDKQDMIILRANQGSGDTTLNVSRVDRKGDKLVVTLIRRYPNTPATPDDHDQIFCLWIPKQYSNCPVEIEIENKSGS